MEWRQGGQPLVEDSWGQELCVSFVRGHWKERPRKRDLLLCPGLGGVPGSFIGTETAFRDIRLKPFLPLLFTWEKRVRKAGRTDDGGARKPDSQS